MKFSFLTLFRQAVRLNVSESEKAASGNKDFCSNG